MLFSPPFFSLTLSSQFINYDGFLPLNKTLFTFVGSRLRAEQARVTIRSRNWSRGWKYFVRVCAGGRAKEGEREPVLARGCAAPLRSNPICYVSECARCFARPVFITPWKPLSRADAEDRAKFVTVTLLAIRAIRTYFNFVYDPAVRELDECKAAHSTYSQYGDPCIVRRD